MEITSKPVTDHRRIFELEMHSILNILNVIMGQLELIRLLSGEKDLFSDEISDTAALGEAIRLADRDRVNPETLTRLRKDIDDSLKLLEKRHPKIAKNGEYLEYREIFDQIFNVLDYRIDELRQRCDEPDRWESFDCKAFRHEIVRFLGAIEKNSHGRYKVVYNIAEQEENDYLVHVEVNSDMDDRLVMPLLVKDTIRDMIANARKYTDPGGRIDVGITNREGKIRFVVRDNGRGIPEDEIEDVVRYGYRGSNIQEQVRTMGNGIGLTKAHYVIHRFNGRLWIDSSPGKGTTITFEIPLPGFVMEKIREKKPPEE